MSLLTIIQAASKRVGLTSPTNAIGLTDANVVRMIELSNEDGKELAKRHDWQVLVNEATHTTLAAESQGLITAIAGSDFSHICNETEWNRTQNRRWLPVTKEKWQQMKSSSITGPNTFYRLRGNYMLAIPTPTAGHTLAFEWVSKNWCESSGGTGQQAWAADSDVSRINEDLLVAGLVWRWKQSQGLEYAEDFRKYEAMVADAIAQDGPKGVLNMGSGSGQSAIGNCNVPEGSWSL